MSTSDPQEKGPLTRKQLREIRLTGATPVISAEEAAAAATSSPRPPKPVPAAPAQPEAPTSADSGAPSGGSRSAATALTRRQARLQEQVRTASVPVADSEQDSGIDEGSESSAVARTDEDPASLGDAQAGGPGVPVFEVTADSDDDAEEELIATPVSATASVDAVGDAVLEPADEPGGDDDLTPASDTPRDIDGEAGEKDDEVEQPTVSPTFGRSVLGEDEPATATTPSFDELLTDSTASQHIAPSALIFTQTPGEGSLAGPVASTGEILITGSYELPAGLGSQGHARGTTDGKDVDAVLIDGELPPASSPTPIAASSAVSTMKPAGEVIRPPAPEKGNRLMLTLAITAGGLALALAVALIVAFSTNVF